MGVVKVYRVEKGHEYAADERIIESRVSYTYPEIHICTCFKKGREILCRPRPLFEAKTLYKANPLSSPGNFASGSRTGVYYY